MSKEETYESNGLKFRKTFQDDGTEVVELVSKSEGKSKKKSKKKAEAKEESAS